MKFRLNTPPPVAIDSIAFADIVINLFVFFFITFGLIAPLNVGIKGTLPIELPSSDHALPQKGSAPQEVTIDRKGKFYFDGRLVSLTQLKRALSRAMASQTEKTVLVRADRTISLERLVSVLDVIRSTQAKAVAIETLL